MRHRKNSATSHDYLCPRYEHVENHEDTYWCNESCNADCLCELIAAVRDDQNRRNAAAELTRLGQEMGLI